MRVRWALAVVALVSGVTLAVPTPAQAAGVLSCAKLPGTFSDVFAPAYGNGEPASSSDLAVHASGQCLFDGQVVTATLDGTGHGLGGGLCGALVWQTSMSDGPPGVSPEEDGIIDVTVTLQDASGAVTTLTDSWSIETENIEAVAVTTGSGAGLIATRIFARCATNDQTYWFQGGTDTAWFTWGQPT